MVIKGEGNEKIYIGKIVGDVKVSTFGEKQYTKTRFGVKYTDGENGVINVETMFELAERCKDLQKHDGVIVLGKLDSFDGRDGSKRWFLKAELVTTDIGAVYRACGKKEPEQTGFTPIDDDEALPFG